MQHQNAPRDTFAAEQSVESVPGRAQTPMTSRIDADVEAIRELQEWIERLWGNLAALSREDLSTRLDLLDTAVDHRETIPGRAQALQAILVSVGTGGLATLSEPTRQRRLYRFRTRCRVPELRFGMIGRVGHDHGSCPSVCCI